MSGETSLLDHGSGPIGVDSNDKVTSDNDERGQSREGRWENGSGRCAVTGRRILGGTGGLRRVMV